MLTSALPPLEETRVRLGQLFEPIRDDLAEVERVLRGSLKSRFPFVQAVVDHAARLCGKRLRPALLIATGRACGAVGPDHHTLAAVVEMIHTATLIHDDVLDESTIRRHASTVNAEWGNETAVLLGDYLFSQAYYLAATLESTQACRWIGRATNDVCEGEMLQVHNRGNMELEEASYMAIIQGKTAELTAVACRLGAAYAGADEATIESMERYGREVGVAFQIADDVLDLLGEEHASGKTLGTDLEKQKLTLPVIRLLATAAPSTATEVRNLLAAGTASARLRLRDYLDESDALEYAWRRARESTEAAVEALSILPESAAKSLLEQAARVVVRRAF